MNLFSKRWRAVCAGMALLCCGVISTPPSRAAAPSPAAPIADRSFPNAPPWVADQTLYEVNLRQMSPEHNVEGFLKQLPRLKDLGVGTLWFMPINPIGVANHSGKLGSSYAVADYKQFNPDFGTLEQFQGMIDQAHRAGMYVIIDWVAPHTAMDHPWVAQHPDWYKHDATGQLVHPMATWVDVAALNYDSAAMRKEMIDSMAYWVRDVGVDGFRCDSAEFVPIDFWCDARNALRKIKPVFMLAEGNNPELMKYAFDGAYAWYLPSNMEGIVKGTKTAGDLVNFFKAEAGLVPPGHFRLNYTSNHDKNAWEGTTQELLGGGVEAFTVLTFTAPGMPLIFNGQETGNEHRLDFFDYDAIKWRDDPIAGLYKSLAQLKRDNRALWDGVESPPMQFIGDGKTSIITFQRETPKAAGSEGDRVVVMLNLSGQQASATAPPGLAHLRATIGENNASNANGTITLQPWKYCVWSGTPAK